MREIKFRAWDGHQMREWGFLQSDNDRMYFQGIPTESGSFQYPQMQYTGLHDKNGVEIYEGDILRYEGGSGEEFLSQMMWEQENLRYVLQGMHTQPAFWGKTWEVIGNIYENPELLK